MGRVGRTVAPPCDAVGNRPNPVIVPGFVRSDPQKESAMSRSLRLALATVVLAALAIGTVASTSAGGPKVLDARMTGIPTGGLVLDGITGGGLPWVLDAGHAKLFADGRLEVEVDGLVLVSNGTNPVTSGHAIVTCGGVAAATTANVPFSPEGDALIATTVELPSPCLSPAVFFTTGTDRWLAVTGF
jgi:hypothetical protein